MENIDVFSLKRISVVGMAGSGKSTLAMKLGALLKLPVHHLDCYYWKENWVTSEDEEFFERIKVVAENDKWIIEGNYRGTMVDRFERSDLIIFLDYDFDFCIQSVKDRRLQKERIGLPDYLEDDEKAFKEFIDYLYNEFPEKMETLIRPLIKQYKHKLLVFKNREELKAYLAPLAIKIK
ncbi:MAG: deoxynucleoside kinase [Erysipelotrichales bacterium]|nr:deoxynucleoside kinase [Erysipelotrichales bacterium]